MNVILDTNILFKDPFFKNTDMQKLISLAKKDIVNLYIPEVVWNEFKSQRLEEYNTSFSAYEKKLEIIKNKTICLDENKEIEQSLEIFKESKRIFVKSIDTRLNDFKNKTKLKIIKNQNSDLEKMWELYFKGELPFNKIKSRNDIPDCFIYLSILQIQKPHVICGDDNLKKALEKQNIKTYTTIEEFLTKCSTSIKLVLKIKHESEIKELEIKEFENYLCLNKQKIIEIMKPLLERELDSNVITDKSIRDDNNEGTIEGIPSIDNINLDIKTLENDGGDFFSFKFSCSFENLVEYYIFKSDFCALGEEENSNISIQDWNDHYYLAEEDMCINCSGTVSIQFNKTEEKFNKEDYIILPEDISFDNIELTINN